jgi:hypothetical protein
MKRLPRVLAALALLAVPRAQEAQDLAKLAKAGVPALSRSWTGADLAQLSKLIDEGGIALPVLTDPTGAAILGRALSDENLDLCRNSSVAVEARIAPYAQLMQGVGQLANVYLKAINGGKSKPHGELARLLAYMVQLAALGIELVDEFWPQVPRDDSYSRRLEGLKKMRSGLTSVIIGAEVSLSERVYTDADRSILLEAMAAHLPRIRTALAKDVLIDLRMKLERDRSLFTGSDAARLGQMIADLIEQEKVTPAVADPERLTVPAAPAAPPGE